jgi:diguanylate cyclase (GGDEF)-like protein
VKAALSGASPSSRLLSVVATCLILASLLAGGLAIWRLRVDAMEDARRDAHGFGVIIAEQTARSMQAVDLVLLHLSGEITAAGVTTPDRFRTMLGTRGFHETLVRHVINLPQANNIVVIGADGMGVNDSRNWPPQVIDASNREYFQHFKALHDAGLFVTEPLHSRDAGIPVIYLARRISGPDGEFLGVLFGAITLGYFEDLYNAIGLTEGVGVTLLRRDGVVIVRYPVLQKPIATRMPEASPWHRTVHDGGGWYRTPGSLGLGLGTLFVSVHPLDRYPIVVDATIAEDVAFAVWRRQAAFIALGALCGVLCILVLMRALIAQFRGLEAAQAALAEKSHLLEITLEHIDQGLIMVNADRVVAVCNQKAVEMLELPHDLIDGRPTYPEVVAYQWRTDEFGSNADDIKDFMRHDDLGDQPFHYERRRPNGRQIEVRTVPMTGGGFVRTYADITERKAADEKVRYLAQHDELTGLANRRVLHARLNHELAHRRRAESCAVLYLDLDQFKDINDTLGHPVGDELLRLVAERMRGCIRDGDFVARLGGDEFAIIRAGIAQPIEAKGLAERVMEVFATPFELNGHQLLVGASLGIAIGPADGADADTLLKNADMALYRAKAGGRGTYRFFEPIMDAEIQERRALEIDLRKALANNEFELFFQPMLDARTKALTGFEALIRWRHPDRGLVVPDQFIPLCEEIGLIIPLGEWVLQEACRQAATWPEDISIAVNLSPVQFRSGNLIGVTRDALETSQLHPGRLELEITESVLLQNTATTFDTLHHLRSLGLRISMDDFGTGYSSLGYLRSFPFDKIKIDKSFIRGLGTGTDSLPIVRAILELGHTLGMAITAEGVETEQQFEMLQVESCTEVQGYLFSRPRPAEDVPALIARFAQTVRIAA